MEIREKMGYSGIGVDFGGQPEHVPRNNWETPMHLSLFTTFCPPNILVCPPNIFDKSTPMFSGLYLMEIMEKRVRRIHLHTYVNLCSFYINESEAWCICLGKQTGFKGLSIYLLTWTKSCIGCPWCHCKC